MAILGDGDDVSLDFRHVLSDGCVICEFRFLWKGEAIVRDAVLQRDTAWTKNRSENAFQANDNYDSDDEEDSFSSFLKEVLESNEADYWEFDEPPDAIVAIYPDEFFPFLSYHWVVLRKAILNDDHKAEREVKEELKKMNKILNKKPGKSPEDFFTFIICAGQNNFKGFSSYGVIEGISLHMIVTREELECFVRDLEREYQEFKVKYDVDEYGECREGREESPFFQDNDLQDNDWRDTDLRNADYLRDADLSNADFRGSDLSGADLRGADFALADLSGSHLSGADLRDAKLGNAKLYSACLCGANLRRAKLRNADLRNANLSGADLRRADLAFADLRYTDLRDADLSNANLYGSDLRGANLTCEDTSLRPLEGANLVLANLEGVILPSVWKQRKKK